MSGECQLCSEHCLDCKCAKQTIPCDAATIKVLGDESFETYAREDGNIGVRPKITDTVIDHPQHYQGKNFEAIDIIEDFNLGFCLGNAIKYILRAGKKDNKLDDLNKAIWYLERECQKIGQEIVFGEQK